MDHSPEQPTPHTADSQHVTHSSPVQHSTSSSSSESTMLVLVILGLVFMYPLGVILMWVTMKKWPVVVKIILSLPLIVFPLLIIFAIVLIFINPAKQYEQANNTKRRSDVGAILNAIDQYKVDNGNYPMNITTTNSEISDTGADLCASIVPTYIAQMPVDPAAASPDPLSSPCPAGYKTGYFVTLTSDNKITVSAPDAGMSESIQVTR